jgi:hypothetical protein
VKAPDRRYPALPNPTASRFSSGVRKSASLTRRQSASREFPRIPLYPDFRRWARWGETLMLLHINYETIK